MAAVTIHSDFRAQEEIRHCFLLFPSICHEAMRPDAMILVFLILSLSQLFHFQSSLLPRGSLEATVRTLYGIID